MDLIITYVGSITVKRLWTLENTNGQACAVTEGHCLMRIF